MSRIPAAFRAEFRGQAPASTFTARETGEVVHLAPNLKFEFTLADGEPDTISIRQTQIDKAADFDAASLKKGDEVVIEGVAVLDAGERGPYFRLIALRRAGAAVKAA